MGRRRAQKKAAVFRVLIANIVGKSNRPHDWRRRLILFVAVLTARRFPPILMLSECQPAQQRLLRALAPMYGMHAGWSDVAMWRRDVFAVVERGTYRITYLGRTHVVPYVLLRHRATGELVWMFPVHLPPTMTYKGDDYGRGDRLDAAAAVVVAIRQCVARRDAPVIFGGDLNDKDMDDWLRRNAPEITVQHVDSRRGIDYRCSAGDIKWIDVADHYTTRMRRFTDHNIIVGKGRLESTTPKEKS